MPVALLDSAPLVLCAPTCIVSLQPLSGVAHEQRAGEKQSATHSSASAPSCPSHPWSRRLPHPSPTQTLRPNQATTTRSASSGPAPRRPSRHCSPSPFARGSSGLSEAASGFRTAEEGAVRGVGRMGRATETEPRLRGLRGRRHIRCLLRESDARGLSRKAVEDVGLRGAEGTTARGARRGCPRRMTKTRDRMPGCGDSLLGEGRSLRSSLPRSPARRLRAREGQTEEEAVATSRGGRGRARRVLSTVGSPVVGSCERTQGSSSAAMRREGGEARERLPRRTARGRRRAAAAAGGCGCARTEGTRP